MVGNIVRRYQLETVSEQCFGIGVKIAHGCHHRLDNAAFDSAGQPRETWLGHPVESYPWLAHLRY
ncbi:hypothetical protein CFB39_33790 [Burkholderia sp. AU6039]|nr:hypothetical protein CFB39_33790 [Burkholderia sp. AU6039]